MAFRKKGNKPVILEEGKIYEHPYIVYKYSKHSELHCT